MCHDALKCATKICSLATKIRIPPKKPRRSDLPLVARRAPPTPFPWDCQINHDPSRTTFPAQPCFIAPPMEPAQPRPHARQCCNPLLGATAWPLAGGLAGALWPGHRPDGPWLFGIAAPSHRQKAPKLATHHGSCFAPPHREPPAPAGTTYCGSVALAGEHPVPHNTSLLECPLAICLNANECDWNWCTHNSTH